AGSWRGRLGARRRLRRGRARAVPRRALRVWPRGLAVVRRSSWFRARRAWVARADRPRGRPRTVRLMPQNRGTARVRESQAAIVIPEVLARRTDRRVDDRTIATAHGPKPCPRRGVGV